MAVFSKPQPLSVMVTFRVTEAAKAILDETAAQRDCEIADVCRDALELYFQQNPPKAVKSAKRRET